MTTSAAVETAGLDAVAQAELVRRGEVTAAELVGWAIERIETSTPSSTLSSRRCMTKRWLLRR